MSIGFSTSLMPKTRHRLVICQDFLAFVMGKKPYSHFLLTVYSHCLKKHKRLLHSKITSKTQVQTTSFTKYSQVTGQVHGWLLHSLKITLSTFRLDRVLSKWLFFDNFGVIYRNVICQHKLKTDN